MLVGAAAKVERLRSVKPYHIDLSLRENAFGSRVGQTLEDKLAILPRQTGRNSLVAAPASETKVKTGT